MATSGAGTERAVRGFDLKLQQLRGPEAAG